ncbi:velvet factor [Diplodia corticola]|uniref:Velvet factor n=1 Tax=Diplodia corticola TaxID=236234 RepID=A0A1J9SLD0_9PEZI|nr:velvet factor [Diplodia corticola]OJD40524.1 velvet factor [Diplodia corticola]
MLPTHYAPPGGYMPVYMSHAMYTQQPQHQHQTDVRPLSRYGGDTSRSSPSHDARLPADDVQLSADVELVIRQQPKEALVTVEGKEKANATARKPVDPPPIIQLKVKQNADPQGHYMQSPYLIMIADLWHPEEDEANPEKALSGTICSSLHRLKDVDNKDGAFFVFGDISIKLQGEHRLRFSLFDIHKYVTLSIATKDSTDGVIRSQRPGAVYEFVTSTISSKFKVVSAKDFHGMDESTYLSRAFSDQGVRLRLRKEPRHVMGRKRSPPSQSYEPPPSQQFQPPTPSNPSALAYQMTGATYHSGYATHGDGSPIKRPRVEEDDSPRYNSTSHVSSSPSSQLPNRQGNLPVQSPSGINLGISAWPANSIGYGSNSYNSFGRGASMSSTSGPVELSSMGPPLGSASMALRPTFSTAHTSSIGLPSVTARGSNIFAGLEGYGDDGLNLGSSYHDRSDSLSGSNSHIEYPNHATDGIRGMPVQSPEHGANFPRTDFHFQPPNLQSGQLLNPFEGRTGAQWPAAVPQSRYEERVSRARSHYQVNSLHNPIGGNDGHHASPHPSTGFDDQYKHEDHHFKSEGS